MGLSAGSSGRRTASPIGSATASVADRGGVTGSLAWALSWALPWVVSRVVPWTLSWAVLWVGGSAGNAAAPRRGADDSARGGSAGRGAFACGVGPAPGAAAWSQISPQFEHLRRGLGMARRAGSIEYWAEQRGQVIIMAVSVESLERL